jgi:hypothetical protein
MSSLIYGIVTAKRTAAPAGQSQAAAAPGMGTYLDTLAALIPAEALALYAGLVIPYTTKTASVHGTDVTVISDPALLQWSCAGLLALSGLLYLVGRQQVLFSPFQPFGCAEVLYIADGLYGLDAGAESRRLGQLVAWFECRRARSSPRLRRSCWA